MRNKRSVYEVASTGAIFASGVYFYRLQAGTYVGDEEALAPQVNPLVAEVNKRLGSHHRALVVSGQWMFGVLGRLQTKRRSIQWERLAEIRELPY